MTTSKVTVVKLAPSEGKHLKNALQQVKSMRAKFTLLNLLKQKILLRLMIQSISRLKSNHQ